MTIIANHIDQIKSNLPSTVKLVAVSKNHPVEKLKEAYDAGLRLFGENKVQELLTKVPLMPDDIQWQFIGHLQTNKVKQIVPFIDTIQSVDSPKLFFEIDKYAAQVERRIKCLLEIHIADEDSKFGFSFDDCRKFLEQTDWLHCQYAYIGGLMGIASNTDDNVQVRNEFKNLKLFFDELKANYFQADNSFVELSMGMSHDYQMAIEEGSSMVRVGTSIFGERHYL